MKGEAACSSEMLVNTRFPEDNTLHGGSFSWVSEVSTT
jgi:hypothetical protein